MLLRVRAVFLKQCLTWMLHGHLQDAGSEFFIQATQKDSHDVHADPGRLDIFDRVVSQLEAATKRGPDSADSLYSGLGADDSEFDWNATFTLRLDLLPEAHVSPRVAS
jgi:Gamma tubulin complex component N-terminal